MPKLRAAIVDAVCRALGVEDRGFAKRRGNIVDVLIDAGCDPRIVLKQAAAVAGVPVVTTRLLERTPPPWPGGVDVMACLARGVIAMAKGKGGEWCFAYLDPEEAADHEVVGVSLDLPTHRPVLGLRAQLLPFIQAADPFQATPTQVLPTLPAARDADAGGGLDEVDEVDSDDDDTFNPSQLDGAPIDAPSNDPLNGNTISDTGDEDEPHNSRFDTLPARQKAHKQLAPFADRLDDSGHAPAPAPSAPRADDALQTARADTTNDDDDGGFFVDDTERLSQATGLKRPPTRQASAPSSSSTTTTASLSASSSSTRPRDSDTQPLEAPKPPARTKPSPRPKPKQAAVDGPVPSWKTPPPRVRELPRQAILIAMAVSAVVVGGVVAWRFGLLSGPARAPAGVVVSSDGAIDVGPTQRALIEQAARTAAPEQRERLLNKAIAFDPESLDGLRALQARAAVLVVLGRKGAATRDLETLKRGLVAHKDVVSAADLTALENSIVSMRDDP